MPSSLLVCSILCQDEAVDVDLGIFPCLLLFRQHFVYTFLPMDMICIAMCITHKVQPMDTSSVSNTRVDPPAYGRPNQP